MARVSLKIKIPIVPNFVQVELPLGGDKTNVQSLAVGELSDRELEELAADWKTNLLANAKRQREEAKKS